MRYIDIHSKNRNTDSNNNMGRNWCKKYLRAIQCILLSTRGVVGPKKDFFKAAFGKDSNEFKKIILLPEDYIINRGLCEKKGLIEQWWKDLMDIKGEERSKIIDIIKNNNLNGKVPFGIPSSHEKFLEHYISSKHKEA